MIKPTPPQVDYAAPGGAAQSPLAANYVFLAGLVHPFATGLVYWLLPNRYFLRE